MAWPRPTRAWPCHSVWVVRSRPWPITSIGPKIGLPYLGISHALTARVAKTMALGGVLMAKLMVGEQAKAAAEKLSQMVWHESPTRARTG